jgi:hypothetical protein
MEIARRTPHRALAQHVRSLAGRHERADGPVVRKELPERGSCSSSRSDRRDLRAFAGATPTEFRAAA